jgi:hypothetical protein
MRRKIETPGHAIIVIALLVLIALLAAVAATIVSAREPEPTGEARSARSNLLVTGTGGCYNRPALPDSGSHTVPWWGGRP